MANPAKKQGASYEARFTADALARGFDVMEPAGDYLTYDRIVVNDRGANYKVQVKGTSYVQAGKRSFKVLAATGRGGMAKKKLEAEEADVLAVFVEPAECWYLIPVEKLTSKSVYLSPEDDSSVGRYEPWKEAWNVFA